MTYTASNATTTAALRTDGDRLWQSLMELARIGATPKGGVNRQALTELDRQGRELFLEWCRAEGCEIRIDDFGNLFARRPGSEPDAPAVLTGSHLDTQPTGGKLDGCYGVLAGLEVIRTLNRHGVRTRAPIELVVWTNEEGCRFQPPMMGSGVFTGQLDREEMLAHTDAEGISVGQALDAIGYRGRDAVDPSRIKALFEAHIEQGPILEDTERTIGVVLGGLELKWFELTLTGQDAHAGPTPMPMRRDALLGAAEITQAVNRIATARQPHGRGTVGTLELQPGSPNVIPGQIRMSIDLRHLESEVLDAMVDALRDEIDATCERHGLEAELVPLAHFAAERFDETCVDDVRQAAEALGHSHMDIVSGAGHDAIFVNRVAPTAMVFVPCENGISHNEIENAAADDLRAGCDVLLHAMLRQAGVVDEAPATQAQRQESHA